VYELSPNASGGPQGGTEPTPSGSGSAAATSPAPAGEEQKHVLS
jgi:hypothetical protein